MVRLTKRVRQQLLEDNEGLRINTSYSDRNYRESRTYRIADGKLFIRSHGKTSWSDSHFDDEWEASDEQVHKFLYKHLSDLDTSGVE